MVLMVKHHSILQKSCKNIIKHLLSSIKHFYKCYKGLRDPSLHSIDYEFVERLEIHGQCFASSEVVVQHFNREQYITGWKLDWVSLKKLVEGKWLYPFPTTSLDPQAYLDNNHGGHYKFD
uniref:AlNc14C116G6538 protein n=1 Tax=Albugo laibachii Nc14 TaxID=890382 RepID=F0WJ02_9STRA|nr:AlNc14C116G6538 [Albugo laibachii Nc14]|eukprot:CCA21248.1 AlNc14C116G6538 [Albugo laibachii Nc14]